LSRNFSRSSAIEITRDIEILGSKCFSRCYSLLSMTFESNSHLTRIESEAFSYSSLQSILIPRNVEILCSKCFSFCTSLSSITFESNSHLTRIESFVFSFSQLRSIEIPRNVQFIDDSAFLAVNLSSISFESGNNRFVLGNGFLIDVIDDDLIQNISYSSEFEIATSIEFDWNWIRRSNHYWSLKDSLFLIHWNIFRSVNSISNSIDCLFHWSEYISTYEQLSSFSFPLSFSFSSWSIWFTRIISWKVTLSQLNQIRLYELIFHRITLFDQITHKTFSSLLVDRSIPLGNSLTPK
jgi:hypothetical protein